MDIPPIDQVIRTNRKTIALIVEEDGRLVIRAPLRTDGKAIRGIVQQKAEWIRAKQALARNRSQEVNPPQFQPGERFWYLGRPYELVLVDSPTEPLRLNSRFQLDRAFVDEAATLFGAWYRQQASRIIPQRAQRFARQCDYRYEKISIKDARSRWGSCGRSDNLSFNWRLVMAPLEVIDYVVVHELVHLVEKNHSPRFWARVARLLPDYAQRRAWLKAHGHQLMAGYGSSKAGG